MQPCGSRQHVIGSACCLPGLQIFVVRERSDNAMGNHASDHPVHCVVTPLHSFTTTAERMADNLQQRKRFYLKAFSASERNG